VLWQSSPDTLEEDGMTVPITMTIPEAVKATGISRTSIYEALKRGDLSARKAGRRTLILFADLQAYLASLPAYRAGV
jgi:excisionase family DNA binding protein